MALNKKAAMTAIEAMVKSHGFKKTKYGPFTKPQSEEVIAWVGLNKATKYGNLEINLVIGLRFREVEKLVYDLLDEDENGVTPPTIAGNVGYVGEYGKYYRVIFDSDDDVERGTKELETALITWGFPFFERVTTLDQLATLLATARYTMPPNVVYRLPVALSMIGRNEEAIEYVTAKVEAESSRTDPAAERYRRFAKNFLQKLDAKQ